MMGEEGTEEETGRKTPSVHLNDELLFSKCCTLKGIKKKKHRN